MAVTRLKRKGRRNKQTATVRRNTIKQLTAKPVVKNVDIEELKSGFAVESKEEPKTKEPEKETTKEKATKTKVAKEDSSKEKYPKAKATKKESPKSESKEEKKSTKATPKKKKEEEEVASEK